MHEGDAGHHLEQFTGNMVSGTDAGCRHVDLAGIGFGICDELGDRLDRYRGIHLYQKGLAMNARDRGDVADQIEIELFVECSVDSVHRSGHKERIPVRGRVYDRLGGDIASRARPIPDDKLLTETLRQPLSYQARHDVGGTTGGKSDNDAHRPGRIALRPSDARDSREPGNTRCKMKKSTARHVHGVQPPGSRTVKTEPLPGSLVTVTSPPIMPRSLREMARPNPVPT